MIKINIKKLKKLKKIFTVDKVSQNMACRPPIAS
jgi:hypothetical protein